jgi:NAD(P)H-hydrate repair Nnr-like enzyme with NAD(P)H-hydrate epimerase domain
MMRTYGRSVYQSVKQNWRPIYVAMVIGVWVGGGGGGGGGGCFLFDLF